MDVLKDLYLNLSQLRSLLKFKEAEPTYLSVRT